MTFCVQLHTILFNIYPSSYTLLDLTTCPTTCAIVGGRWGALLGQLLETLLASLLVPITIIL
jgi:membrane glycosyltransferase